ncbi:hypothetical protein H9K75_01565 [Diaphorobacter aerolatus]|uniref:Uncharacterized protein n=1 Tax=Diaphorobacter aerolatus TaxID=1288495 RepID=A0A7H0GKV1_9BURK|nr:hypothetical protein H9K75_01565 [Diaphorobacter aerolatus]
MSIDPLEVGTKENFNGVAELLGDLMDAYADFKLMVDKSQKKLDRAYDLLEQNTHEPCDNLRRVTV